MRRRKRELDHMDKASRGAQLLKANRRRGLGRGRGTNEPQDRFISKNDRPHANQGTRG